MSESLFPCRPESLHLPDPRSVPANASPSHAEPEFEETSFSFENSQVARGELFAHSKEPTLYLVETMMYVNMACLRKLPDVEFIQVLVNEEEKKIALRPSSDDIKDSFAWCTGKHTPRHVKCEIFIAMVRDMMGWGHDQRRRILGKKQNRSRGPILVFNLESAFNYPRRQVIRKDGKVIVRQSQAPVFPESWKDRFGLPIEEHEKAYQVTLFDGYVVFDVTGKPMDNKTPQ